MQTALEAAADLAAFPKATADVYCLVLEAGGSELAVAVTAAALALADAGIPLFDLVSACSVVSAPAVAAVFVEGRSPPACLPPPCPAPMRGILLPFRVTPRRSLPVPRPSRASCRAAWTAACCWTPPPTRRFGRRRACCWP